MALRIKDLSLYAIGDDQAHACPADLAGIRRELERDHSKSRVAPQVFQETGEGRRRAVGLEALDGFVGFGPGYN